MRARPILFALAAGVAGCCGMCAETTKSENIRTEGMRAETRIVSRGDGKTSVDLTLRVGGVLSNVFPVISGGDRIEITDGRTTVPLAFHKNIVSTPGYLGSFDGDVGGRMIELKLHRVGNTSALGTRVTMPPAFAITTKPSAKITGGGTLDVAWSPTGAEPVSIEADGSCIEGDRATVSPDTGRAALKLKTRLLDGSAPGPCDVRVKLVRQATGTLDPAFGEGGSVTATQERTVTVEYIP